MKAFFTASISSCPEFICQLRDEEEFYVPPRPPRSRVVGVVRALRAQRLPSTRTLGVVCSPSSNGPSSSVDLIIGRFLPSVWTSLFSPPGIGRATGPIGWLPYRPVRPPIR